MKDLVLLFLALVALGLLLLKIGSFFAAKAKKNTPPPKKQRWRR